MAAQPARITSVANFFHLFPRHKPAPAARIDFRDYADYASRYKELAIVLGHPERNAHENDLNLIRGLMAKRTPREGSLNLADTLFLAAMTSILSPERVIEVGTGTGFSSAVFATMLQDRIGAAGTPVVDTIDANEQYGGDATVRTGADLATLIPELASSVRVHIPRQSDFVDQLARPDELEFAFIDANHQHPCPLLDLLRLARVTRPGGWIALHDVALGSLVAAAECAGKPLPFPGPYGAEWLFESWPFAKVKSGNSGAVQIPPRKREIQRVVSTLMKLPFEIGSRGHRRFRDEIRAASRAVSGGA